MELQEKMKGLNPEERVGFVKGLFTDGEIRYKACPVFKQAVHSMALGTSPVELMDDLLAHVQQVNDMIARRMVVRGVVRSEEGSKHTR